MLCQRYLPAFAGNLNWFGFGTGASTTSAFCTATFPVQTRVAPTGISVSSASHFTVTDVVALASAATSVLFYQSGTSSAVMDVRLGSGITTYRPTTLFSNSASANLYFTGCEL
jgi:hypothetical protein